MKKAATSMSLLAIVLSLWSCTAHQDGSSRSAEKAATLLVNGDIVTMNPASPTASVLAFSGDRIVAIGNESEVRSAIGGYAKFYNLEGRTVVPGFFETHDHLYMSGMTAVITDVTPFTTPTLAAALEKISHTQPDNAGWIIAFGADQQLYEERRGPTRDLLDPLFPDPSPAYARVAAELRPARGVTTASEFPILNTFVLEGLQQSPARRLFRCAWSADFFQRSLISRSSPHA